MSQFKIKILLVGIESSSKASSIYKIIKNKFDADYKLTVGVGILTKDVEYKKGEIATLSIWDLGSEDRFKNIRDQFYKGSVGALLVFDLTQEITYNEVREWFSEINESIGFIPFILIGNKLKLMKMADKELIREDAREFAKKKGGVYIEISPEEGDILEKALQDLTHKILELHTKKKSDRSIPKLVQ